MTRKILSFLAVGMFVATLVGVAGAEAPVMGLNPSDEAIHPSAANPESAAGQGESWQEREALETGSLPSTQGDSAELRCCEGDSGPILDHAGDTVPRQDVDSGS